jgi:sulfur-oxidizing protein SoxY
MGSRNVKTARRNFLHALPALATLPTIPAMAQLHPQASRLDPDITPLIETITGGAPAPEGRVRLTIPQFAENGQSVPVTLAVTDGAVKSLHLFAPRNPRPNIANFHFGPRAGTIAVNTRVRLAGTQTLRVICAFADGSFAGASAPVEVTASACLDQST